MEARIFIYNFLILFLTEFLVTSLTTRNILSVGEIASQLFRTKNSTIRLIFQNYSTNFLILKSKYNGTTKVFQQI